jgi:large subunit ribosomal protein L5
MAERIMAEKKTVDKKKRASKKEAPQEVAAELAPSEDGAERPAPAFLKLYESEAVSGLMEHFKYTNRFQVPRLQRIVVNMGMGAAVGNPKVIDTAVAELGAATGQRPIVTRAKKAIAAFKLREGMRIGVCVTLRRERMWAFMERLVMLALPRVRDFRGVSPRAFDGAGNYTLGLREQIVFPEIQFDKVDAVRGMNITFVTTARTNEEGRELLKRLGMPFRS